MIIYKYYLVITDTQSLNLPEDAQILSVAEQNGELCLWALVIPDNPKTYRTFEILGTGNPIPKTLRRKFIGTVPMESFMWHVFERLN